MSTKITSYRSYLILGLALDVREHLAPELFERLYHGPAPQSNAEADEVIDLLLRIKKKAANLPALPACALPACALPA